MKQVIIKGFALVVLFLGSWFALRQINWMSIFKVEKNSKKLEEKLGDQLWDFFKSADKEIKATDASRGVNTLVDKICKANNINREYIKVHLLATEEVNAFALPNGHLVVYSGLIKACKKPEVLGGVIAHEIAHIEQKHVMKKLMTEMGLSLLLSAGTGAQGTEALGSVANSITSSAFDRELEKEADLKAVDYLFAMNVSAVPFAEFLYQLSTETSDVEEYFQWVSTHPTSEDRMEYILETDMLKNPKPIMSESAWQKMLAALE